MMPPEQDAAPFEQVVAAYRTLARLRQASLMSMWVNLNLTLAQVRVLFVLLNEDAVTVGQVAERLGIGNATTSPLIDQVLQMGLVERMEATHDRRCKVVKLTPRGEEMALNLCGMQQMCVWLRELTEAELREFLHAIEALLRVAGKQQ
jgi:DNA-binding MarR family transcriptional regulator